MRINVVTIFPEFFASPLEVSLIGRARGDGLLDALGGANRTSTVTGPLGDAVDADWRLSRDTAVIEMARASGLVLVGGAVP